MQQYRYVAMPEQWPGKRRPTARTSPYRRVTWAPIEKLLERELAKIGARDVTIALDIRNPAYFRQDGGIRSDARPASRGVIVSFTDRNGVRLTFPCDTYGDWTHNVYAIAKTLEKLRLIERDGVVQGGQQYVGFKQLPSGVGVSAGMSRDDAAKIIAAWSGLNAEAISIFADVREVAVRAAKRKAHPDSGFGASSTDFQLVTEAERVLLGSAS